MSVVRVSPPMTLTEIDRCLVEARGHWQKADLEGKQDAAATWLDAINALLDMRAATAQ